MTGSRAPWRLVVLIAVIAAGVSAYQLSRPGLPFGVTPDVSAWFGGSVRLVHGALPYRDFGYTQPPGFPLLTTPFALLSETTGTRNALALLRLLTPLLAAGTVLLVGSLVRRHGLAATVLACGVMALHPAELYALRGPQLEPVLDVLCLGALRLAFRDGELLAGRRLAAAGVVMGFAVAVKLPAIIPAAVLGVVCLRTGRGRLLRFGAGVLAGTVLPCAPFFAAAPQPFLRDVIGSQLSRIPATGRTPVAERVGDLTAASAFTPSTAVAMAAGIAMAVLIVSALAWSQRRLTALEWFVCVSTAAVSLAQLAPARYYPHYAAFAVPFIALALAFAVGRVPRPAEQLTLLASTAAAAALLAAQIAYVRAESVPDVARLVDSVVPLGACVISDGPALLVTSDRFVAAHAPCPPLTDPEGATLALGYDSAAAARMWSTALEQAAYVVTRTPISRWTYAPRALLPEYVATHFRLVRAQDLLIYVRTRG